MKKPCHLIFIILQLLGDDHQPLKLPRLRIRSEGNGTLDAEFGGALDAVVTLDLPVLDT